MPIQLGPSLHAATTLDSNSSKAYRPDKQHVRQNRSQSTKKHQRPKSRQSKAAGNMLM